MLREVPRRGVNSQPRIPRNFFIAERGHVSCERTDRGAIRVYHYCRRQCCAKRTERCYNGAPGTAAARLLNHITVLTVINATRARVRDAVGWNNESKAAKEGATERDGRVGEILLRDVQLE